MATSQSDIAVRITELRRKMEEHGIDAYLVPGTDPHQSEYPPEHFHCRHWLSGFYGSAGTLLVTQEEAGLWTDSRYFLEAEERLSGTPITLFKMETAGVRDYPEWLAETLQTGQVVSFDARLVSVATFEAISEQLEVRGVEVLPGPDLLESIWEDRPPLPAAPIYIHEEQYAGESAENKIERLRGELAEKGAEAILITALDEIAWLLNLRGSDVAYNPIFLAYLLVESTEVRIFVDESKLAPQAKSRLESLGVARAPYDEVEIALKALPEGRTLLYDGKRLNTALYGALPEGQPKVEASSPVATMKARKNDTQLRGIREAMRRDGAALVSFFLWLEEELAAGRSPTEREAGEALRELRATRELFVSEAFNTIAGYGPNGAIVHYAPPAEGSARIGNDNLLLLDSGGQYIDGTTDITRTTSFGIPTEQQRLDYTLVLKGHLAVATTPFPKGTTGHQLDTLARQFLWKELANYGHGTGHGVGHFLNVHEGPQRISQKPQGVPLEEGMVISNEPGVYRNGEYGIRIENLVVVRDAGSRGFEEFHHFETVTLFPYERKLIDVELLSEEEVRWIDGYHQRVYQELAPLVDEKGRTWLEAKTAPLTESREPL
ncbi:MAG: aminopeptidase P family protein [Alkalispirochaetaceae bacterium]